MALAAGYPCQASAVADVAGALVERCACALPRILKRRRFAIANDDNSYVDIKGGNWTSSPRSIQADSLILVCR